jgi:alkylation response protein AidB-like acyl-CoA dehydrogenase/predicted heme/steroid binding protein
MPKELKTLSKEDVAKHNTAGDCWVIVDGGVYDVSRFAKSHPGGELLLLEYAGQDITETFYSLHRQEVLDKYRPRLLIGHIEGVKVPVDDGLSAWGRFSKVPYAETFAWRGFHSPYHTEQHKKFRQYVREFLDREGILEEAIESETSNEPCTLELMQKISSAGLLHTKLGPGKHLSLLPMPLGMKPEEFTYFHDKIIQEETARMACPGFVDSMFAGFTIGAPPLFNYGTDAMKQTILPDVLAGRKRIALAITEAFAGSDVASLRTIAVKSADGSHYIVNGTKKWISSGTFADYFVTAVRTGGKGAGGISMMLIPRCEGVETKIIKTAYSSSAGTAYITFENVKVPVENLMGKEGGGFKMIMANFNHERWVIAVSVIATARVAIEECFKWATQRKVFGQPLMAQSVIREKLGMMVAAVETVDAYADLLTHQMNNMSYAEQNEQLGGPISLLKYQATRVAHLVADQAVQTFGGRAFTKGGIGRVIETFARTYKAGAVYGGSEEIMVDLGVRQALKSYPPNAKL